MDDDDLIEIATFPNAQEAAAIKGQLVEAGVDAVLEGEDTAAMLSHLGSTIAHVSVLIRVRDRERVVELLKEWDAGRLIPAWICRSCQAEVDAGFAVCWNCGAEWNSEQPLADTSPLPAATVDRVRSMDALDPFLIDASDPRWAAGEAEPSTAAGDDLVDRAYRAAVYGSVFPPLTLYSLALILSASFKPVSPHGSRRFYGALVICVVVLAAHWVLWSGTLR